MAATLMDVVKATGLSSGTVSQILRNNDARYSDKTRARVMEAAKALNYQPNALAQGIRSGRSGIVGLLIPRRWDISADPFASVTISCLEQALLVSGRKILLASLPDEDIAEHNLPDLLTRRYVDHLLVYGCRSREYLETLRRHCPEMVVVDEALDGLPSLTSDHAAGGRLAVEHLWANGHRQFAVFGSPEGEHPNHDRRAAGFLERLGALGGDPGAVRFHRDDVWSESAGARAAAELLADRDPATAVFALNDTLAVHAVRYLSGHGVRVPEDVSVVGFDDTLLASALVPALTTIHVDRRLMAEYAVAMLSELTEGRQAENRLVPVRLVERQTVCRRSPSTP